MHKVITFGIPSYNAAKDMDHCITSILEGSNYATDIEIIIVDDGSKDETAAKADGKVTRAERRKLERQANRDSKAIHRQKHDKQTAAPAAQ